MGWRNIVITQHSKLSYSHNLLVVQNRDGINQIPVSDIDMIFLDTTQVVITASLIAKLTKRGIKIVFTDDSHQPVCSTESLYPNNRSLELLDQQRSWSEERKKILWTKIVSEKITNQIRVLDFYDIPTLDLEKELDKLEINDITNREAVVAKKYFELMFGDKFTRRDFSPMNAALNYGYSILLSAVTQEIVINGCLTYIGIHHVSQENQFNLGSDLMEPFRPIVDYWLASQKFNELTPDVRYGLIDLLNIEIIYNGKNTLLRNAIASHVRSAIKFLNDKNAGFELEVRLKDEVPAYAINGDV